MEPQTEITVKVLSTQVTAVGVVYGDLWGGGSGVYPARKVVGPTREVVVESINRELRSGGLDSGFGYKSLKGAYMVFTESSEVEAEGSQWEIKRTATGEFFGDLDEEEQEHTLRVYVSL